MHAIHTTPGFVVSSRSTGEAGKFISIFTRDLGLIRASAQGIRFEKSKLRPFIQDYSLGVFSFVRGKEFWRLTNAQENILQNVSLVGRDREVWNVGKKELIARIALLLGRLLQGEDAHPELFVTLDSLFVFLANFRIGTTSGANDKLNDELLNNLESLIVVRILHRLGYVANIPIISEYLVSDKISEQLLMSLKERRVLINQHINKALRESHL